MHGVFSSPEEVRLAYDHGELDLQASIRVRIDGELVPATAGRVLLYEIVPKQLPFKIVNRVMGKKQLGDLIDSCYRACGQKETVLLADKLRSLGYTLRDQGRHLDLRRRYARSRRARSSCSRRAQKDVQEIEEQYTEGLITDGERYNKVVDIWAQVSEQIAEEMMGEIGTEELINDETGEKRRSPSFNPIYIMADSGARGSAQQIRQLAGMRGLMAKPSGEIIETPITTNFREGLSVLQYFISTHGARKGLADTALKTANSGYLTRRLVDVAQDCIIAEYDCGTIDGIELGALVEGGEIIEKLGDRILGRVALDDIFDPYTGEVLVGSSEEITEEKVKIIEDAGIDQVKIRSVLTCETRRGICVLCYGRDLARGHMVNIGEAVGVIAAQSIGEPGTQLTMRTFHIGGVGQVRTEQSQLEARYDGVVKLENTNVVKREKVWIVMNRHGEIVIAGRDGPRARALRPDLRRASCTSARATSVKAGQLLSEWDPFSVPILTEVTRRREVRRRHRGRHHDASSSTRSPACRARASSESKDAELRPAHLAQGRARQDAQDPERRERRAVLPAGRLDHRRRPKATRIEAGDIIARIPRETTKTKDITGGLPRVAELFEARKPKEHAVIAEIDGTVSFGKDTKGKRKVLITPERGDPKEYLISKGKHLAVREGDKIRAGEPLMDGAANPHDILKVLGEKALAKYLVDEVQEVYRLQGVKINDKHIETIVRQMLRRIRVIDVGDTGFLVDEHVEKYLFEEENERVHGQGRQARPGRAAAARHHQGVAVDRELHLGVVVPGDHQGAHRGRHLQGKVDYLRGLKENVIMGRLIPAGTGLGAYKRLSVHVEDSGADDLPVAAMSASASAAPAVRTGAPLEE